jgi:sulfotransferase family protein
MGKSLGISATTVCSAPSPALPRDTGGGGKNGGDGRRSTVRQYDCAEFHRSVRGSDVFLCTYPKSGTTWLGFMLAQVLKGDVGEELGLDSFNRYVPDVNLLYTKRGSLEGFSGLSDPRFFLCHAAFDLRLPRVVYVMRDPRDVMLSYWHYQKFLVKGYSKSLREYLEGDDQWPCRWDDHVASWLLPRRHPNLLVVKYEEIQQDAAGVLRSVLGFAGVEVSEERIVRAVEASRFERMRASEEKFGVSNKSGDEAERFVRKGKAGSWREEMSEEEVGVLEEKYGEVMRAVGYGVDQARRHAGM